MRSQSFNKLINKMSKLSLYEKILSNIESQKIDNKSKNIFKEKKSKENTK